MRRVLTEEEHKLLSVIKPYAVYPPINGYPVRPDAPKEIFEAVERLTEIEKGYTEHS